MTQKWNLQDIRPVENKTRPTVRPPQSLSAKPPQVPREPVEDTETTGSEDGNQNKKSRLWLGIGLCVLLIGGAFGLSVVFAETTLTVKPEFRQPNVNAEFEANKERQEGGLSYEIMTLEATAEKQVTATGQKEVKEQTKGTIEIFKTTAGSERLIKNTRFESGGGLVFRIQESVVVPGATEKDGKKIPGSIKAQVFAETIGEAYNLPAGTRFTIPGFKESNLDELFNSMYAVNPETFVGGYDGQQFIIDDAELNTARQALQTDLHNQLLEKIKNERPSGFVAFEGSYSFTYNAQPAISSGGNLVTIKEQAVLQVPLFKAPELASFIAAQTVPTYNGAQVRIDNYADLLFSYVDPTHSSTVLANLPSLKFTLVGKPLIVWEYDAEQLRTDLAGKPKTAIATVLTAYSGTIKSAQVSTKPFYRRSFPQDGSKIRIIEVLEE